MVKFVYQFDLSGYRVKTHFNLNEASIFTKIKYSTIQNGITNESLVNNSFYFSYNKNFKIPVGSNIIKPKPTKRSELEFI